MEVIRNLFERKPKEDIMRQYKMLHSKDMFEKILNSLPHSVIIVNDHNQMVFSNQVLLGKIDAKDIFEILSRRPGELFTCVNADKTDGGCGTSEACKYCNILSTLTRAQEQKIKVEDEASLVIKKGDYEVNLDFLVAVTPIMFNDINFYIITLTDISGEKRKQQLESIFFHDIINSVGGIKGLLDISLENTKTDKKKIFRYISKAVDNLLEEIRVQKDLITAEKHQLEVNFEQLSSLKLLKYSVINIESHEIAMHKNILLEDSDDVEFQSDFVLLNRIIINMLKNALEAQKKGDTIRTGCKREGDSVVFYVRNSAYIPEEVQHQIFQRNFSTKEHGRGLGCYSMKIIGEWYLEGEISFESDRQFGTVFYLKVPVGDNG
ncbi:MAG: ATP-binding protein [Candidatus Muiribacteriaceae bacterium]